MVDDHLAGCFRSEGYGRRRPGTGRARLTARRLRRRVRVRPGIRLRGAVGLESESGGVGPVEQLSDRIDLRPSLEEGAGEQPLGAAC